MEYVKPDIVTTPPTLTGQAGRAWGLPLSVLREKLKWPPVDPTVSAWLIERLDAHPVWHSYFVFAYHLRDEPGRPLVTIRKPGATHEFMLLAANPEYPREPVITGDAAPRYLTPANFCAQFEASSDQNARIFVISRIIQPLVDGRLNPDTDYVEHWFREFGRDAELPMPMISLEPRKLQ